MIGQCLIMRSPILTSFDILSRQSLVMKHPPPPSVKSDWLNVGKGMWLDSQQLEGEEYCLVTKRMAAKENRQSYLQQKMHSQWKLAERD